MSLFLLAYKSDEKLKFYKFIEKYYLQEKP